MRTMRAMNVRRVTSSATSSRVRRLRAFCVTTGPHRILKQAPMVASVAVVLMAGANRALGADLAPDTNAVWLAEHYTKYEHRIPMRDGVRLFTRVYIPKDDA